MPQPRASREGRAADVTPPPYGIFLRSDGYRRWGVCTHRGKIWAGGLCTAKATVTSVTNYQAKIKKSCVEAGTYQPFFDASIETLAQILHKRDQALKQYETEFNSQPVITYTNKASATNPVKNPALVMWNDLNNAALSYWRELGLTPAGLKKINETAMKPKKKSALAEALNVLS